ncbi:MAG: hypothetical protein EBR02_00450 [Alphaproteobacteria bacterium]|nr:hypothetical protein [Alphaproteobacteria bacterium]
MWRNLRPQQRHQQIPQQIAAVALAAAARCQPKRQLLRLNVQGMLSAQQILRKSAKIKFAWNVLPCRAVLQEVVHLTSLFVKGTFVKEHHPRRPQRQPQRPVAVVAVSANALMDVTAWGIA